MKLLKFMELHVKYVDLILKLSIDLGEGFIEIHHLKPMFSIKREIKVNPQKDLVPLCSNCHKMIHRNTKNL